MNRKIGRENKIRVRIRTKETNWRRIEDWKGKSLIVLFERIGKAEEIKIKRKGKTLRNETNWRRKKVKIIGVLEINWRNFEKIIIRIRRKEVGNGGKG